MLSKKYLLNSSEFQTLRNKGKLVYKNPLFNVVSLKISNLSGPKFGFVISKKIDKKAVVRNKIKRQLAESVRLALDNFQKDCYFAFYAKQKIKSVTYEEISSLVDKTISKIHIV